RETVGSVPTVLTRDVVTVLALLAGQGDLRPHVGGSHVGVPFSLETMDLVRSENTTRFPQAPLVIEVPRDLRGSSGGRTCTDDTAIMSRLLYRLSYPAPDHNGSEPELGSPRSGRQMPHRPPT